MARPLATQERLIDTRLTPFSLDLDDVITQSDRRTKLISHATHDADKAIDTSWRAEKSAEAMAGIARQAKTISTSLLTLKSNLQAFLAHYEIDAIASLSRLMSDIGDSATAAKERADAMQKRLAAEEKKREAMARNAVNKFVDAMVIRDVLVWIFVDDYLAATSSLKIDTEDRPGALRRHVDDRKRELINSLVHTVSGHLKSGLDVDAAIKKMVEKLTSKISGVEKNYGSMIDKLLAALVQDELSKAQGKT